MQIESLKERNYVDVIYERENKLVCIYWKKKKMNSAEYRNVFTEVTEFALKNPIEKFLSDITHQGIVSPKDRKWFQEVAVPGAMAAGLKKAAVVYDGNIFKKYYLTNILSSTNKFNLPFKFFGNIEEAKKWLISN